MQHQVRLEPESHAHRRHALLCSAYERERLARIKPKKKGQGFYQTPEWNAVRMECLRILGEDCCKCGSSEKPHVDHSQSRKAHPDLALKLSNMQVLCKRCNFEKQHGCADYRTPEQIRLLEQAEDGL